MNAVKHKSFSQWLQRIEALHPEEIELGLERLQQVAARMEPLLPGTTVLTVAGSNGKGSCIAVLEGMALCEGIRVGAYTSPHLLHFTERLRIDGRPLPAADWCAAFERVEAARAGVPLTFFEFTTLAALHLLREKQVQLALLEVGLGGRLDAVNLVEPEIAVLCSVDLEHQQWLGEDRESIGREKAAIFRPGRIAVCGDRAPPDSVLRAARDTQWYCLGEHFDFVETAQHWSWSGGRRGRRRRLCDLRCPQLAPESAAVALQAWHCLYPERSSRATLEAGLGVSLPGRRQAMRRGEHSLLLDVAHNPAAARGLCSFLGEGAKYRAVCGMLADKDSRAFVAALAPAVATWYLAQPGTGRAMPVARLQEAVRAAGGNCRGAYASVSEALCAAAADAKAGEPILVTGSFYTVAEVLAGPEPAPPPPAAHCAAKPVPGPVPGRAAPVGARV